jgi:hypothetical protein
MKIQILLTLIFASFASAFQWYPLGNWIEEEGTASLAGHCVKNSMDGKIIAISAPHYSPEETPNLRFGRVVVYTFDELRDAWDKLGGDITGEEGDRFGSSLGMSEDGKTVIVGSLNDNKNGAQAGMVQVFVLDNVTGENKWTQKGQTIYGENAFDEFGYSVDVKDGGEVIAIGSPAEDISGLDDAGAVRVYKWGSSSSTWEPVEGVIEGTLSNGRFGHSLALSQVGIIAVGVPHAYDSMGDVQMVHYNATDASWKRGGPIVRDSAFELQAGDMFGYSVSVSFDGSTVAVGAPLHRGNGNSQKKLSVTVTVHKFDRPNNIWKQMGDEIIGRSAGDQSGTSVHLSDDGTEVAIGAPFSSKVGKTQAGRISVYRWNQGTRWEIMDMDIDGKTAFSNLGSSVALSGDGEQVMGGAPTEGYATVYQLTKTASPTSSPTRERSSGSKGQGGGGGKGSSFIRVIFNIAIVGLVMFAIVKIIVVVRNKRSLARFQATAVNDLEMAPHGVPEGETRDVI